MERDLPMPPGHDNYHRHTFHDFFDLMRFKVTRILLVSSLYDAFTLEEDGLLTDQISGQYSEFELSTPPRVIRVSSGEEALQELQRRDYDLIITDLTMPKMTGDKLAEQLMAIRPDIPIILCTGFSERITEETAKAMGIKGFVLKPIVIRELGEMIQKILDG